MNRILKRMLSIAAVFCLLSAGHIYVWAAEESALLPDEPTLVYLNASDAEGTLLLSFEEVSVGDSDGDGVLTVWEALRSAHLQNGGAEEAFRAENGVLTGFLETFSEAGFAVYADHVPVTDLQAEVTEDSVLSVFPIREGAVYCRFGADKEDAKDGQTVTLRLFSEENGVEVPVVGAELTVAGKRSGVFTDENGEAGLLFSGAGFCLVSAVLEGADLIPPVCAVVVTGDKPSAGDKGILIWALIAVGCVLCCGAVLKKRHA